MSSSKSKPRGRRGNRIPFAAAFLIPVLVGCMATGGARGNPMEGDSSQGDEIEILVRNLNFNQVTVYTARSGSSQRLGIVPGKGEATFKTRWFLPDIQLRVKFLAGSDFFTEILPVGPGELLELTVLSR